MNAIKGRLKMKETYDIRNQENKQEMKILEG